MARIFKWSSNSIPRHTFNNSHYFIWTIILDWLLYPWITLHSCSCRGQSMHFDLAISVIDWGGECLMCLLPFSIMLVLMVMWMMVWLCAQINLWYDTAWLLVLDLSDYMILLDFLYLIFITRFVWVFLLVKDHLCNFLKYGGLWLRRFVSMEKWQGPVLPIVET